MLVIIGAGISGLTTAKNLKKDEEWMILEKENHSGGLSTQYESEGYWFDFGGHYFHFQGKPEIKEYLANFSRFKEFQRKSKSFLLNRYIPFPVQFHLSFLPSPLKNKILTEILDHPVDDEDNLETHPQSGRRPQPKKAFRPFPGALIGDPGIPIANNLAEKTGFSPLAVQGQDENNLRNYLESQPQRAQRPQSQNENNLHDYLETHFGRTLFELFFHPFLTKYYGADLHTLAAGMDKGSIPVPDKEQVAAGFKGKTFSKTGYNPVFYYPKPSLRHFIETYSRDIEDRIHHNQEVIEIDCQNKYVRTRDNKFSYRTLVNTMPLKQLLTVIKPRELFPSPQELHHLSTLVVNVILKRKRKRFHWIYLPEQRFPFYRVGFYPVHPYPACYLERTVNPEASIDKPSLLEEVFFTLKELKVIEGREEIVYIDPRIIPVSYIIFTRNWHAVVPPLLEKLRSYDIYSIGRYGSWNYTSMSDDVKSAIDFASGGSAARTPYK